MAVEYTPAERRKQEQEWQEFLRLDWPQLNRKLDDFIQKQTFERQETDKWVAQAIVQGTQNATAIGNLREGQDVMNARMDESMIYQGQTRDQVNALSVRVDSGLHKIFEKLDRWEPYIDERLRSENAWKQVGKDVRHWQDIAWPAVKIVLWIAGFLSAVWVWTKGGGWNWPR